MSAQRTLTRQKRSSKASRAGRDPVPPRILKSSDFGEFEPELLRAFRRAFHFDWDAVEDSPEEQQRRKNFARILRATRSKRDPEPSRSVELLRQCYDLYLEICVFLQPDAPVRDELDRITAAISIVGEKMARLKSARRKSLPQKLQPRLPSLLEVRDRCALIEEELRVARDEAFLPPLTEELARLRAAILRANKQVEHIGVALERIKIEGNEINAAAQVQAVTKIAASLAQISLDLKMLSEKCTPSAAADAKFRSYFERVARSLPVQVSFEAVHGVPTTCFEVPSEALNMPRALPEQRGAILERLCTLRPEFLSLLPSAARRGHRAPASQGGRGQRNWVLSGITAALVLLELVDEVPDAPKTRGRRLFDTTRKRIDGWIRSQASTGHFYVRVPTATAAPTEGRAGRARHGTALEARYAVMPKVDPE